LKNVIPRCILPSWERGFPIPSSFFEVDDVSSRKRVGGNLFCRGARNSNLEKSCCGNKSFEIAGKRCFFSLMLEQHKEQRIMKMISKSPVSFSTVKLIGRLLTPIVERGVISQPEFNELMANLRHLSQKGELIPDVLPKLIDQKEAAELLGVSFSHFRNLERVGTFPFKRRMVGTAVRYRNTDVIQYLLNLPEVEPVEANNL
jgi:predicted DNA-binding transcriptional regulator AlpA